MTTPANNQPQPDGLTPESLASRLFDIALNAALSQGGPTDPAQLSQQVIDFLGGSLVYALTSAKRDVIVFFSETLLYFAAHSSPDPAQRAAMLKHIGDMFIANAATTAAAPPGPPVGAPPGPPGPPAPGVGAPPSPPSPPVGAPPGVPTLPKP